ncbi:MAG: hypothetical protein B6226_01330 [Candidatus Cloacimonetes bacterium 4572_65]|nr:MAG: hypothetical protein B6226_01330 [Candidatus Cloacimonetes bacterium 4572_65]
MLNSLFEVRFSSPVIATAIHNGNYIRPELRPNLAITDEGRRQEEDPFTDRFINSFENKIVINTSRFEIDINRRRDNSVYQVADDCWGLEVWKESLTEENINQSLAQYDTFYRRLDLIVSETIETFGYAVILDVHSFNHHRLGIGQPFDDIMKNPQVILGTNIMPDHYEPLVLKIQEVFKSNTYEGKPLECELNLRFPGGNLTRHLHREFPNKTFAIAIEFKKSFMNEWSGELYNDKLKELTKALESLTPFLAKEDILQTITEK